MKALTIISIGLLISFQSVRAADVIDLGEVKIEGAARGPEIQMIGSDNLSNRALEKIILNEIRSSETELLSQLESFAKREGVNSK